METHVYEDIPRAEEKEEHIWLREGSQVLQVAVGVRCWVESGYEPEAEEEKDGTGHDKENDRPGD